MGSKVFFEGRPRHEETQLEALDRNHREEDQQENRHSRVGMRSKEQEAIEFILHAMTEKFLASKGIKRVPKKKKMFGFI